MKTKLFFSMMLLGMFLLSFPACDLIDDITGDDPGGEPSPIGAVNNEFSVVTMPGISNGTAIVTEQSGDVSTISYSATITDPNILALVSAMPDVVVSGNSASVNRQYRITTEGIQSVYEEGNLTLMDYKAKVGDKWSLKHDGNTLVREVTEVSKEDDYAWGFMLIKTVHVEETGRNIPGVSKIEFVGNHRFGMVGVILHFEDGSSETLPIFSDATNEDE